MLMGNKLLTTAMVCLLCTPAVAQEDSELEALKHEAEVRRLEAEVELVQHQVAREQHQVAREQSEAARKQETAQVEVEARMRDAERALANAARQMAELSMERLPRVERIERFVQGGRGPVLGVTIGSDDSSEPVAGVELLGVSPGGAAAEAGLRAGDVITSINSEELTADNSQEANSILLDFMQGVEEGDALEIEYLRNGKSASVELTPRPIENNVFAFGFDGQNFEVPDVHVAPNFGGVNKFIWTSRAGGFGDMELVKLTERLGSYFGAEDGLLVVRAPEDEELQLEDGDVILNIDGRQPTSVAHAMRILGSYEGGEELKIEIMRDKRKRTITLEIPDSRQSSNWPVMVPDVEQKIVVVKKDGT